MASIEWSAAGRMALSIATQEARRLKHSAIGAEHLLLGLVRVEGPHVAWLRNSGAPPASVIESVLRRALPDTEGVAEETLPFDPAAKRALERAAAEALRRDAPEVAPEHLMLALLALEEGIAQEVLQREFRLQAHAFEERLSPE